MKQKLLLQMSLPVLGIIFVSSLQAMEIDEGPMNGTKTTLVHNRAERDRYIDLKDDENAMTFALKVMEENPEPSIDDRRCVRDIFYTLAKRLTTKQAFEKAIDYAKIVLSHKDKNGNDLEKIIDIYTRNADYDNVRRYSDILTEQNERQNKGQTMKLVLQNNQLFWGNQAFACSWGHGGIKLDKQEGDRATPVGTFSFRRVFYRSDRLEKPETVLPLQALSEKDGWCDDINDTCYNQHVCLPYQGRYEELWREDHVYDIILVVGHNDNPIEVGKGSAIFIHLRRPEGTPTEGCVALELQDLLKVLKESTLESSLVVIGQSNL